MGFQSHSETTRLHPLSVFGQGETQIWLRCLPRTSLLHTLLEKEVEDGLPSAASHHGQWALLPAPSSKLPSRSPCPQASLQAKGIWFISSWQCHPPECHGMQKSMKTRDPRHVFLFVCMCQHFQCLKNVCLQKLHVCYSFRIIFSPYNRRLILSS